MISSKNWEKILLALAALFLFSALQHGIPLWSSDEGRFSEVAREMWESKNFVIPHFNYVPFLDKPILAPLLTCFFYAIFGVSDTVSRLVPITTALLGLFILYRFARRLFDESTAFLSTLILLTTAGYVLVGRFAVIDMLMTFWISLSLFCMLTAFLEKKPSLYLAAYAAMGFGFLTKGLIGFVLPGMIFFAFLVWTKNLGELKRMKIPAGILILALIILPWFYLAMKANKDFYQVFIIEQHVHRFSTGTFGRKRPFWFFIPILIGLAAPWSFFVPAALMQGLGSGQPGPAKLKVKFLLCWLLGILLFFSIPKSKLPYYILPATVPLALLVGNFFTGFKTRRLEIPEWLAGGIWIFLAFASVLGAISLNIYLSFFAHKPAILALKNFALLVSFILAVDFVLAFLLYHKGGLQKGIYGLAITLYTGLLLIFLGMKMLSPIQSTASEAAVILSEIKPGDEVAVYASPDRFSDLPFHLKKCVITAGSDWGTLKSQSASLSPEERDRYFMEFGPFMTRFKSGAERIFCLTEEDRLQELTEAGGLKNYKILSQANGKVLIVNR